MATTLNNLANVLNIERHYDEARIVYTQRAAADTDGTVTASVWYGGYGGNATH